MNLHRDGKTERQHGEKTDLKFPLPPARRLLGKKPLVRVRQQQSKDTWAVTANPLGPHSCPLRDRAFGGIVGKVPTLPLISTL